MKLVQVDWLDHSSFSEAIWRDGEEYTELAPAVCRSVGWLFKDTDTHIILVHNIHDGGEDFEDKYVGDMCIIKGGIIKMRDLT